MLCVHNMVSSERLNQHILILESAESLVDLQAISLDKKQRQAIDLFYLSGGHCGPECRMKTTNENGVAFL